MSYISRAPPLFFLTFLYLSPRVSRYAFIYRYVFDRKCREMDAGASLEFRGFRCHVYMCTCIIWNSNLDRPPDPRDVILLIFTTLSFVRSAHLRSLLAPDSITRLSRATSSPLTFITPWLHGKRNETCDQPHDEITRDGLCECDSLAIRALICVLHNKRSTSITV